MSKISEEIKNLNLEEAEAFFAITIHRQNGRTVPTATVIADTMTDGQRRHIVEALLMATRIAIQ